VWLLSNFIDLSTDYTVIAHDILIFDKYFVVFVRYTDNNQQLNGFYSSKCGIQLIQTVIVQWSKAQVSNLVVMRSSHCSDTNVSTDSSLLNTANTYISYMTTVLILCFMFLCWVLVLTNRSVYTA